MLWLRLLRAAKSLLKTPDRVGHNAALCGFAACLFAAVSAPSGAEARYAAIVIEATTGQVLHAANADTRNYPASLTKMMTLYLAFDALEAGRLTLGQRVTVSRRAAGMSPSRLGLRSGETISVKNLILALVTKSANDAAVVLAEALGGTEIEFARTMTEKARALGMSRTTFRNASGLHNRAQLSTARDMATLARALLRDHPGYYRYFSTPSFTFDGHRYRNHNRLLTKYPGTDGIKTGYLSVSGFNLAASTVRNGQRLIAVVFGGKTARSRDRHMMTLLDRAFARLGPARVPLIAQAPSRKPLEVAGVFGLAPSASDIELPESKPVATVALPGRKPMRLAGLLASKPAQAAAEADEETVQVAAAAGLGGPWGVQVGAFYRYSPAERAALKAANRLPELLGETQVSITHIRGERGRIYRARLMGLSRKHAEKACRRLESIAIDCFVVRTGRDATVALVAPGDGMPPAGRGIARKPASIAA